MKVKNEIVIFDLCIFDSKHQALNVVGSRERNIMSALILLKPKQTGVVSV